MKTFSVANMILQHFINKEEPIRNMKLQKLLYFSCGWYSVFFDKKEDWLIDDDFYAYPYGPVCPAVYYEVYSFGREEITELIKINTGRKEELQTPAKTIINNVIERYGSFSDWQLSNITHKNETPWTKTINEKNIGALIERDIIRKHYQNINDKQNDEQ